MDIEEEENLRENDKEFINGLRNDNNINNDNKEKILQIYLIHLNFRLKLW